MNLLLQSRHKLSIHPVIHPFFHPVCMCKTFPLLFPLMSQSFSGCSLSLFLQVLTIRKCAEDHHLIHHSISVPAGSDVIPHPADCARQSLCVHTVLHLLQCTVIELQTYCYSFYMHRSPDFSLGLVLCFSISYVLVISCFTLKASSLLYLVVVLLPVFPLYHLLWSSLLPLPVFDFFSPVFSRPPVCILCFGNLCLPRILVPAHRGECYLKRFAGGALIEDGQVCPLGKCF